VEESLAIAKRLILLRPKRVIASQEDAVNVQVRMGTESVL